MALIVASNCSPQEVRVWVRGRQMTITQVNAAQRGQRISTNQLRARHAPPPPTTKRERHEETYCIGGSELSAPFSCACVCMCCMSHASAPNNGPRGKSSRRCKHGRRAQHHAKGLVRQ